MSLYLESHSRDRDTTVIGSAVWQSAALSDIVRSSRKHKLRADLVEVELIDWDSGEPTLSVNATARTAAICERLLDHASQ